MNVARLNINVGGRCTSGYKGNDSVFDDISALIGEALPRSYIDFIRDADGGHPEIGCFRLIEGDDSNLFEVDWFYSVGADVLENVQTVLQQWKGILGERILPIARDGGGNQIFLDMSSAPASVWILLHDEDMIRLKVAQSFEDFIAGLMLNPDLI